MTLNANFPGAVRMASRSRLEGPERGLDALVGLVILVAELFVGLSVALAFAEWGIAATAANPFASGAINDGFAIAVFGAGAIVLVTSVVYLVRVVRGRRSWSAPLWGLILMSGPLFIGYLVMSGAL